MSLMHSLSATSLRTQSPRHTQHVCNTVPQVLLRLFGLYKSVRHSSRIQLTPTADSDGALQAVVIFRWHRKVVACCGELIMGQRYSTLKWCLLWDVGKNMRSDCTVLNPLPFEDPPIIIPLPRIVVRYPVTLVTHLGGG